MNPQVTIDSQSIQDSLKRNGIGKAVVSGVYFVIVYYSFTSGFIGVVTMVCLFIGYSYLQIFIDYFISVSVIIDKGIIALLQRTKRWVILKL